jgi:alpha-L-fucosidase
MRQEDVSQPCPKYLAGFEDQYSLNPHEANLAWFRQARFGLFIHWGLFSYAGPTLSVASDVKGPFPEHQSIKDIFSAEKFDADFITDLALEAEMKYITFVARHHDSFSLWDSQASEFAQGFSSMSSPARRDFVGELAEQCAEKGLALFIYYSYALDWVHPFFPTEASGIIRAPEHIDGYHTWTEGDDNSPYVQFMHDQITELLTHYGHIAGMWFDPISSVYQRPDLFPIADSYALVRQLQPHCLIAFKNGTGSEDFISPEVRISDGALDWLDKGKAPDSYKAQVRAYWDRMVREGCKEFCGRMEEGGWFYAEGTDRIDADEVVQRLAYASSQDANMLLNTGPLLDGSIHPAAVEALRETGRRIREQGWPAGSGSVDESVLTIE